MKRRITACLLALALVMASMSWALADTTYTARTPLDGSSAKRKNIALAAAALDGAEVEYGEEFSFNDAVGPRTSGRGYVTALNGRGAKVTGGGVAQVAATLYLALRKLGEDIEYTELSTYGKRFTDDYVSSGDLAVVTDYSAGKDFAFINRAGDMEISMWVGSGYVNCTLSIDDDGSWFDGGGSVPKLYSASIDLDEDDEDTLHNIRLAAESVYDTTLAHGDRFSFNKVVGPRTEQYGYVSGVNGRGVKVTGGGVAQVASAIWLAVKDRDDISVTEKSTYGSKYNQDYVDSSADAIITDYKAGTDFSFKYTGDGTITIYTYVDDDELKCDIAVND
ncbi:MAG: VanW family protein [Clostridia bacterium]|nr:VanW family protein [Clostridia bacterium]